MGDDSRQKSVRHYLETSVDAIERNRGRSGEALTQEFDRFSDFTESGARLTNAGRPRSKL